MTNPFQLALAQLTKTILEMRTYRLQWVMRWFMIAFNLVVIFFLARLVDTQTTLTLPTGSYFTFLILGFTPMMAWQVALNSLNTEVQASQRTGMLEVMLTTPLHLPSWVLSIFGSKGAFLLARIGLILLLARFLFGGNLGHLNLLMAGAMIGTSYLAFIGLGLLATGFTLAFKRGNPIQTLLSAGCVLLGGVLFPVSVLPEALQQVSNWVPVTHAAAGMRRCAEQGTTWSDLWPALQILLLWAIILLPLGSWAVKAGLNKARRDGTIGHF